MTGTGIWFMVMMMVMVVVMMAMGSMMTNRNMMTSVTPCASGAYSCGQIIIRYAGFAHN